MPDRPLQGRATAFWVATLCIAARRAPWAVRLLKPLAVHVTWLFTPPLRSRLLANAPGLLGPGSSPRQRADLGRAVIASFHDFIVELAALASMSPEQARRRISDIEGREHHEQATRFGRGVIFVTAHMGSFEVGLAALAEVEPHLHVVFKRDEIALFESARARFRMGLGVHEHPIDGGVAMWSEVASALRRGETVLMQGDRVLDGQTGAPVRFAHGAILAPEGPAKLARLTGAPILPVVATRDADGRLRIAIDPPIDPPTTAADDPRVLQQIADALGGAVLRHPGQWLTLHDAFLHEEHA